MCGKECVAIASDNRLGINQQQTTAVDFQKIFEIHPKLFIAMSGLASDMHTLKATFEFKHKLYELRENRVMEPKTFASVVSTTLMEAAAERVLASVRKPRLEHRGELPSSRVVEDERARQSGSIARRALQLVAQLHRTERVDARPHQRRVHVDRAASGARMGAASRVARTDASVESGAA